MDGVTLAPGLHVAGKYALLGPLARGAMGEVWRATHLTLGGELAVKFLSRSTTHGGEDEATAMARFRFEAQVAARLSRRTRHIVSVTDHGEEHGFAYLVMELVKGESLEAFVTREGRLSLATLGPIVAQIARGLSHAHADGVFHRDLKPANVLLTTDEDGALFVKILDFGIAKAIRSHKVTGAHEVGHATEVGIVLGTPSYMSPEQARGLASLDHRCDLWALAALTYEALCGRLPYEGETTNDLLINVCSSESVPVRAYRPDLPPAADAFFARAFAERPNDRFQDAASFARAFADVVAVDGARVAGVISAAAASELSSTAPTGPRREPPPAASDAARTKRRTRVASWIGALVVVLASAVAVMRVSSSREDTQRGQAQAQKQAQAPAPTEVSARPPSTHAVSSTAAPPVPSPDTPSAPSAMKSPEIAASKPANTPMLKPTEKPTAAAPVQSSAPKKSYDKGEVL